MALQDVTPSEPEEDLAKPHDGELQLEEIVALWKHVEKMRVHSRNRTCLSHEESSSPMVLYQLGAAHPLREDLRLHTLLVALVYDCS